MATLFIKSKRQYKRGILTKENKGQRTLKVQKNKNAKTNEQSLKSYPRPLPKWDATTLGGPIIFQKEQKVSWTSCLPADEYKNSQQKTDY